MKMSKELQEKIQSLTTEELLDAWNNRFKNMDTFTKWYYKNIQDSEDAYKEKNYNKILDLTIEVWEMFLKYKNKEEDTSDYSNVYSFAHSVTFLKLIKDTHKDLPYYIALIKLDCNKDTTIIFINKIIEILKNLRNSMIKDLTQGTRNAIKEAYKGWCLKNDLPEIFQELFNESPF